MKRLDFLIIFIIVFICASLYVTYFAYKPVDASKVEVYYQNTLLGRFSIEEETTIYIAGDRVTNTIKISFSNVEKEFKDLDVSKDILNTILINNSEIKMVASNCPNHYCEAMSINKNSKRPIVCTNGIVVKLAKDDIDIIV